MRERDGYRQDTTVIPAGQSARIPDGRTVQGPATITTTTYGTGDRVIRARTH